MIVGVVLAAGAGRRFGQPKASVMLGGQRFLDRAVLTLLDGGCQRVVVVVREADLGAASQLAHTVEVVNPEPTAGMSSSLRLGLQAVVAESDAAAGLIALVDQIGITSADVARVIEAFHDSGRVAVARRAGRRSHPVLVPRALLREVADSAVGDSGARAYLDHHGELTYVDLDGDVMDIDTTDDLVRALARLDESSGSPRSGRPRT